MGYYTDYHLKDILSTEDLESIMKEILPNLQGWAKCLNHYREKYRHKHKFNYSRTQPEFFFWDLTMLLMDGGYHHAKWYERETEMNEFSKLFPNYIFLLEGRGEEEDDMWHSATCNGYTTIKWVELNYPPLNLEQFRKEKENEQDAPRPTRKRIS